MKKNIWPVIIFVIALFSFIAVTSTQFLAVKQLPKLSLKTIQENDTIVEQLKRVNLRLEYQNEDLYGTMFSHPFIYRQGEAHLQSGESYMSQEESTFNKLSIWNRPSSSARPEMFDEYTFWSTIESSGWEASQHKSKFTFEYGFVFPEINDYKKYTYTFPFDFTNYVSPIVAYQAERDRLGILFEFSSTLDNQPKKLWKVILDTHTGKVLDEKEIQIVQDQKSFGPLLVGENLFLSKYVLLATQQQYGPSDEPSEYLFYDLFTDRMTNSFEDARRFNEKKLFNNKLYIIGYHEEETEDKVEGSSTEKRKGEEFSTENRDQIEVVGMHLSRYGENGFEKNIEFPFDVTSNSFYEFLDNGVILFFETQDKGISIKGFDVGKEELVYEGILSLSHPNDKGSLRVMSTGYY